MTDNRDAFIHTTSETRRERAQMLRDMFRGAGGYTLRLYTTDGGVLCRACCREEAHRIMSALPRDGWEPIGADVLWEGPSDSCDNCGRDMPSEYGDSDEHDSVTTS